MATVVDVYVARLTALASARSFCMMVHPVPPALDETRQLAKLFNAVLRRAVQAEPNLHWLDFSDALLSPDGEALADGLALDGTHMHPSYVSLLEAALPQ